MGQQYALRPDMPELPYRMKKLPVDKRGFPIPWFVAWVNGEPEFRAITRDKFLQAAHRQLCWICGHPIRRHEEGVFVIGPMCAVTRTSGEPPSHEDCAKFAAVACPF